MVEYLISSTVLPIAVNESFTHYRAITEAFEKLDVSGLEFTFLPEWEPDRKNYYENLVMVTLDYLNGIAGSIALLNQEYFRKNFFFRIRETLKYEKTPKNYRESVEKTTNFKIQRRCSKD